MALTVSDPFSGILGQPRVRDFLRSVVASGRISHAYLFTGPAGSNKTAAAYALAQAILCEQGGCGTCDACRRVRRRSHPDVRYFAPEGQGGYLISQMREILADVSLAPIQAKRKVYIIDRADLLGTAAANAFLKTLEEPPSGITVILLGRTRESVLPTIVSRCQVVAFSPIPETEAIGIICQNSGIPAQRAKIALSACDGSITRAIEFCGSNRGFEFRSVVLEALFSLRQADDWDVLGYSKRMVEASNAALDAVRAAQEADLAENADFLEKAAVKQIEARNKRALAAKSAESLRQLLAIVKSWLRDLICAEFAEAEGASLFANADMASALVDAARHTSGARAAAAMPALERAYAAIAYNVSPQTCIDALLFEIREVLYGPDSPGRTSV